MSGMNSYERVMACFAGEKPDRVPVIPVVREWCCKQAGIKFTDTMNNVEKHVYSQYYCARKFGYDVVTDIMGIHAESEAMGAVVKFGENYPPTISDPVINNYEEDLPKLRLPDPHRDGRLPLLLECVRRLKELCGGEIPVMGYVQCPFRHAAMLRGAENLMRDTYKNKENARKLLEIATNSQIIWGTAIAQAGADIVFFSDPTSSGDVVSSKTYKDWGLPYTQRVASAIKRTGVKVLMHVCGDTSDRLEILASAGVDGLSLDAKVDFAFARETLGPDYLLMGNVEPTNPITMGKPETVYEYSQKAIEQAGKQGHFLLSGGCLIPAEAPVENVEAMVRAGSEHTY
ncbi:MAG: uroporphyrinogen decarboxylase family protein [Pseudomonadota bacterium]